MTRDGRVRGEGERGSESGDCRTGGRREESVLAQRQLS